MDSAGQGVTVMYWAHANITNGSDLLTLSPTGASIASPIIMFFSGVVGNLLALLVLRQTRMESQRLMFHSLVAGLVWNDLVGILLTSPVTIASYVNGLQMPGGEHLCTFNGFVMVCFGLSTPLIVSAMAIERLLFVHFTFFYTKHCAPSAARMVMLVIAAFVLAFGLLPLFGFGNYGLQYPRTWCFLDYRTRSPVNASYGYIYSTLNLLLVVVMVICNLVVVVTLARVRDYRRKYSTSSVNSNVMIGDGVVEDCQRQQAARRRNQKDTELQMIVVVCTITTIFAVCWAPLMIHINLTLASEGQTQDVLGLVAIRLASLNQTLNPWLYVILRRTLVVRIKEYCSRWRRFLRIRSNLSTHRCHQKNITAAISLPDVMRVNNSFHNDQPSPLPDVAKAQSFAGRISHTSSSHGPIRCAHCPSHEFIECVESLQEK